MPTTRPLKVFLCHASADKPAVRKLYHYLRERKMDPWLNSEKLLPGQNWQVEIPKALFSSDVIIVCLSKNSVDKEGYVQKEIKFALDKALEMPEGRIFLIPARLEECDLPYSLRAYQYVNLFEADGYRRLLRSLRMRAEQIGATKISVNQDTTPNDVEKAAREKAEHDAAEKDAREKLERDAAEKLAREKAEQENAEKIAREEAERKAVEKAAREEAERKAAQKKPATQKQPASKSFSSWLMVLGIILIVIVGVIIATNQHPSTPVPDYDSHVYRIAQSPQKLLALLLRRSNRNYNSRTTTH